MTTSSIDLCAALTIAENLENNVFPPTAYEEISLIGKLNLLFSPMNEQWKRNYLPHAVHEIIKKVSSNPTSPELPRKAVAKRIAKTTIRCSSSMQPDDCISSLLLQFQKDHLSVSSAENLYNTVKKSPLNFSQERIQMLETFVHSIKKSITSLDTLLQVAREQNDIQFHKYVSHHAVRKHIVIYILATLALLQPEKAPMFYDAMYRIDKEHPLSKEFPPSFPI